MYYVIRLNSDDDCVKKEKKGGGSTFHPHPHKNLFVEILGSWSVLLHVCNIIIIMVQY